MLNPLRLSLRDCSPSGCLRRFFQKRLVVCSKNKIKDLVESPTSSVDDGKDLDVNIENRGGENAADLLAPDGKVQLDTYAPYFVPTFNFAAYVNKSPTLQELVKLGVNLNAWEKRPGIPNLVLKLDFERDIKNTLRFLCDQGVPADMLGYYLTRNPLILKEKIEDLQVRINYLESKKFTPPMVQRVITANPYWLMFSTVRIDRRLGHFQQTFDLSGEEVRTLSTRQPRLITYNMENIREVTFTARELMGYEPQEMKVLLLKSPKLWMMDKKILTARFNYIHTEMGISHEQLLQMPGILKSRIFRIKQRHMFIQKYCSDVPDGRSRYDPKSVRYISLDALVSGSDADFCMNVAKVSIDTYNAFLKSL